MRKQLMKSGRAFVLIAMVMNAEWAKAEGDSESFNQFGSRFGGPSGLPPQGPQDVGTFQAAFEVRTNSNEYPRGKQVKQDCAVCHKLSVLINGREYGDGAEVTLRKGETHTVKVKDTPVPRDTPPGGDSSPPHTSNQKFTVWPQAVDGQTITSIQGNGPADSPQVFIAKKAEILQYLLDNSEGLMAQDKDWPENPADEPMNKTARLLPVDIDFIHPATGEMDESRETSEGGYIAIRRDEQTPVTKLKLRKLDGMANAQFKLVFSSSKMKLWKDAGRTQAVESDSTTFPVNQDTELFFEGVEKSSAAKDIEIGLKVKIGSKEETAAKARATVVQSEFPVVVRGFIPHKWTEGELPFPVDSWPFYSTCIGGNRQNFSLRNYTEESEFKLAQTVVITPYEDLHADVDLIQGRHEKITPTSLYYDRNQDLPELDRHSRFGEVLVGAANWQYATEDPSHLYSNARRFKTSNTLRKAQLKAALSGEAGGPGWLWGGFVANIDYEITIHVEAQAGGSSRAYVGAKTNLYPAYEVIAEKSDQSGYVPVFQNPPHADVVPGPVSLNTSIEVNSAYADIP